MGVLPVCTPHACSTNRYQKRASAPPGTRVTDNYEPPWGCWELNLRPLEEQPVSALNHCTEPPLQPHLYLDFFFLIPQNCVFIFYCYVVNYPWLIRVYWLHGLQFYAQHHKILNSGSHTVKPRVSGNWVLGKLEIPSKLTTVAKIWAFLSLWSWCPELLEAPPFSQ